MVWKAENTHLPVDGFHQSGLWVAGNEGMEKKKAAFTMGYTETTIRMHPFIPSQP